MFSKNSMISFEKIEKFLDFYVKVLNVQWKIRLGKPNNRGEEIYNKTYTEKLRKIFNSKNLFRRSVSIAEIVSWLDSFVVIESLVNFLKKNLTQTTLNEISLHCEYKISMSKNRRVDFVIQYKKRVLLVEFRVSEKFPNISNVWQKKELELIIYKELIKNYIDESYRIYVYAFIAMPEYKGKEKIHKHVTYNEKNVAHLGEYIIKYILGRMDYENTTSK